MRRHRSEAAELKRSASRTEAGEAAGFLKDVLFKYLVASEDQQTTIFPLLASVVQFTKPELEHIRRTKEHQQSTTTASGILSAFFLAPPTDEQDGSFQDPAAGGEKQVTEPEPHERFGPGGGAAESESVFAGWLTPSTNRTPAVSATPLRTPFSSSRPPAADAENEELKKKVLRLKKLLSAANAHIETLRVKAEGQPPVEAS